MEVFVEETQRQFDLYHCHIFLVDETGRHLRVQACGWQGAALEQSEHGDSVIEITDEKSLIAQTVRGRQAIIANNVTNSSDWLPNERLPDTRSELVVPMIVGERVIGVLDLQSTEVDHFAADDIKIQSTLAIQIAIALENARSLERSQQAVEELNLLTRRLTRESWDEYISMKTDWDAGYIYDLGQLSPLNEVVVSPEVVEEETAVSHTNGAHSHALTVHGETIGHLTILDEDKTSTDMTEEDDQAVIHAIAAQLSARIENLRLTEQTQTALSLTENLYEASERINNAGADWQTAVNAIATAAPISVVNRVTLYLFEYDQTTELKTAVTAANWHSGSGILPTPVGTRYEGEALQTMRWLVARTLTTFTDIKDEDRLAPQSQAALENLHICSMALIPLIAGDRQLGSLVYMSEHSHKYTSQEMEPHIALAGQLALSVDRQRLVAETQARAERERHIRTITDKIRRGIDRDAILSIAQEEISQLLGAKTSAVQLGTQEQLLNKLKSPPITKDSAET